jgi:nucleoside-diphosphate-sugar epimerase
MMATEHDVTGPINIGNPHEITVGELAERIELLVDRNQAVQYLPLPIDDPQQRKPDISRARQALGWEPTVALEEGLSRTFAWFRENYGKAASTHKVTVFTPQLDDITAQATA